MEIQLNSSYLKVSAIDVDVIEVDPDSFDMLKEMGMEKISGLQQTTNPMPFRGPPRV